MPFEVRIEGDPEEPTLGATLHGKVDERLGQQPAVPDDADVARLLLGEEDPPVGGEGDVRGEGHIPGHGFDRGLRLHLGLQEERGA